MVQEGISWEASTQYMVGTGDAGYRGSKAPKPDGRVAG